MKKPDKNHISKNDPPPYGTYKERPDFDLETEPQVLIKQNSSYISGGKSAPDNNPFWENGANPLSSKGN